MGEADFLWSEPIPESAIIAKTGHAQDGCLERTRQGDEADHFVTGDTCRVDDHLRVPTTTEDDDRPLRAQGTTRPLRVSRNSAYSKSSSVSMSIERLRGIT